MEKKMKRFLYYNQDTVNSLLAQIEQGLLIKKELGGEESNSSSSTTTLEASVTGDLEAKVFGIGASMKGEVGCANTDEEVTTKMIRSVQEKALHDYAFDRVYAHVTGEGLINNDDPEIGDFISVTDTPTFLDFDYFKVLFSEDGAVRFSNAQEGKEIKRIKNELQNNTVDAATKNLMRLKIKEQEEKQKAAEEDRKDLVQTIKAIQNTLPYNRFILTDKLLVPLDDENFRDKPNIIGFKYGGEMTIFGYVTNIVSDTVKQNYSNDFASFYQTMNKIMLSLIKGQNRIYVVHPIALFY